MPVLRTAVIGAVSGIARSAHLPVIGELPETELVGLVDLPGAPLEKLAAELGVPAFAELDELVDVAKPDCVHVCSTDACHAPQTLAALAAGLHVLVQKPMALTTAELRAMLRAAEQAGRRLQVSQNDRYRAVRRAMRAAIDAGAIGTPVFGRFQLSGRWFRYPADSPYRERAGGGQIVHNGMHYLDTLCWLTGDRPVEVQAQGRRWFDDPSDTFETPNYVQATIRMASGHFAQLTLDQIRPAGAPPREELTVIGTTGLLRWETSESAVVIEDSGGRRSVAIDPDDSRKSFRRSIGEFSRAVLDGADPPIEASWSAAVCAACLRIAESCDTGQAVAVPDFSGGT